MKKKNDKMKKKLKKNNIVNENKWNNGKNKNGM